MKQDPLQYFFNGRIQAQLFNELSTRKKLPLLRFKRAYVNPEIGTNVLKKMIMSGICKIDQKSQTIHYIEPENRVKR